MMFKRMFIVLGLVLTLTVPAVAQTVIQNDNTVLKQIIIFGRHSIRSSTVPLSALGQFAVQPWPAFNGYQGTGCLTLNGQTAATYLGQYFRHYLIDEQVLLSDNDQKNVSHLYFRSNCIERSFNTAYYFWQGLIQDQELKPAVHSYAIESPSCNDDPVFDPISTGVAQVNTTTALNQVLGIYGDGEGLTSAYNAEFSLILNALQPPNSSSNCPGTSSHPCVDPTSGGITFMTNLQPATGNVIGLGALQTTLEAADPFVMQYADNMTAAWGAFTPEQVSQHTRLIDLAFAIEDRLPYLSQVQSSNAASHILRTMQNAQHGYNLSGAFGNAGSKVVVVISSDNYVAGLAGILNLHWQLPTYQPDFCAPGGALVFELRQSMQTKKYLVRVYYTAQTFDQLRSLDPLNQNPPATMQLFVPGGSTSVTNPDVDFTSFQKLLKSIINPKDVEYGRSPALLSGPATCQQQ
jgi:4-phytase/acid phosphatase